MDVLYYQNSYTFGIWGLYKVMQDFYHQQYHPPNLTDTGWTCTLCCISALRAPPKLVDPKPFGRASTSSSFTEDIINMLIEWLLKC